MRSCCTGLSLGRAALIAVLACVPACKAKKVDGGGAGPAASASGGARLTDEMKARVLAKVGDRTITLGDYATTLDRMDQFERLRYETPSRRKQLLEELINAELLAQEARRRGLHELPETQERIRLLLRDEALADLRSSLPKLEDIPSGEVGKYYETHLDEYTEPERRRISAIVMSSPALAKQVLGEARSASAEQWGALVRKHSAATKNDTEGMPRALELEGDLGFVTAPGVDRGDDDVPDAVRAAAFSIRTAGGVHPAVVSAGGRHYVVRLVSINPPRRRSLQEADRPIRVKLLQERYDAALVALDERLRAKFPVKIDRAALSKIQIPPATSAAPVPSPPPSASAVVPPASAALSASGAPSAAP